MQKHKFLRFFFALYIKDKYNIDCDVYGILQTKS